MTILWWVLGWVVGAGLILATVAAAKSMNRRQGGGDGTDPR